MIDFHAHTVPGADHGCNNTETALSQLKLASDAGVGTVVAVSHYYPDMESVDSYISRVTECREQLRAALADTKGLPRVIFGTEAALQPGFHRLPGIEQLCIQGTNCILVEMPYEEWTTRHLSALEGLVYELKLCPVLAHVDRYNPRDIEQLFELGIQGQVNCVSCLNFLGRKRILRWIDEGYIAAVGSDIHGIDSVYRDIDKVRAILGRQRLEHIESSSAELLNI